MSFEAEKEFLEFYPKIKELLEYLDFDKSSFKWFKDAVKADFEHKGMRR